VFFGIWNSESIRNPFLDKEWWKMIRFRRSPGWTALRVRTSAQWIPISWRCNAVQSVTRCNEAEANISFPSCGRLLLAWSPRFQEAVTVRVLLLCC
jgi:hypothetical protein